MRASSVLFACVLATLLLLTFAADEAYWMPTEEDLAHVQRAVISIPPKCEGGKYPGARKFLGVHYLKYPEHNFQAVWLPGPPKINFFSKAGETLREVSIVSYEASQIVTVLAAWGFKENAKEALDYRTKNYIASSAQYKVEPAAELKRDETGKVLLPDWFVKRQEQIQNGEIDPDDPKGIPRSKATVDEDGNPWFIKTPFDPNAPLQASESADDTASKSTDQATTNAPGSESASNDDAASSTDAPTVVKSITLQPVARPPVEPINVVLQPGERTIIYQDASAPHDEL